MSSNQQSDVKGHLSDHTRSHIHLMPPAAVPESTAASGAETGSADPNTGKPAVGTLVQSPVVELRADPDSLDSDSSREVSPVLSDSVQQ
jgi:hypothetical protein